METLAQATAPLLVPTLAALFAASLGLLAYAYVGYPLLARVMARRTRFRPAATFVELPPITVVIAARNEATRIGAKLDDLLAEPYPAGRLSIVVASDGSTDGTDDVVRRYARRGVTLVSLASRVGKPLALDAAMQHVTTAIVVFADARQRLVRGALAALVEPLADPAIGCVSGQLETDSSKGPGLYWRLERALRADEARWRSVVGATGAFYAMRRSLYAPLAADTLLDDVVQPMRVVLGGARVWFEETARVLDDERAAEDELDRKARTLAGNYQLVARMPELLSPRRNPLFLELVSHKLLRLAGPFALLTALGSNVALVLTTGAAPFVVRVALAAALAGQLAGYGLALVRAIGGEGAGGRLASVAHTFVVLNVAAALGLFRFLRGDFRWSAADDGAAARAWTATEGSGVRRVSERPTHPDLPRRTSVRASVADSGPQRAVTRLRALVAVGTRPEMIKLAPVLHELARRSAEVETRVVFTGQHKELLDDAARCFDVVPDRHLDVMKPRQTLEETTAALLTGLGDEIRAFAPDVVVAQGDTTTVFSAALAAFYAKTPFAHVEAGLRTSDPMTPFPEEMLRRLVSRMTALHFAPTRAAEQRLLAEGVAAADVLVTGNTVIDALLDMASRVAGDEAVAPDVAPGEKLVLLTMHRRESFGGPHRAVMAAVERLVAARPDVRVVFPVHPNPLVRDVAFEVLGDVPRVQLVAPLDYRAFVAHLARADLVLTDSGGVQEEAPSFGAPVLVLRDETERAEGVDTGALELVGTDEERVYSASLAALARGRLADPVNPYGDGRASARIVDSILTRFARRTGAAATADGKEKAA